LLNDLAPLLTSIFKFGAKSFHKSWEEPA